jgi:NodT family efflux transporter outer membrane factor (OMF) lipoprotein
MQVAVARHLFLFFVMMCILSGCYGPYDFVAPEMVPGEAITKAINYETDEAVTQRDTPLPADWWLLFHDDQLTCFIQKALARNPTLQSAQSRISAALYDSERLYSFLVPNVNLSGDIQRVKLSKTGVFPADVPATIPASSGVPNAPVVPSLIPFYFTLYEAALNFKYDLDLWHKNRNAVKAALDEVQARLADEAFIRLNLTIAVAQAYWQLQVDYARWEIARRLIENRAEFEEYIRERLSHNIDTNFSRNTARLNLTSVKQGLLEIEGTIAVHEHQLKALLADDFDECIAQLKISHDSLPRVPIPEALPLHLIGYRPDIMSQLWIIQASCRQIDIAKAGFYPDVNLMGFYGQQTIHPSKFWEWKSGFGVAEGAFTLPIFDGGYLKANLLVKEVDYDIAILKYNQLILDAVKEVLDGISLLDSNYKQFVLFQQETEDQYANLTLMNLRQKHHIATGIDQLNSEQNYLIAKDQQMVALGKTLQSSLQLIKALGGGYDACMENEIK